MELMREVEATRSIFSSSVCRMKSSTGCSFVTAVYMLQPFFASSRTFSSSKKDRVRFICMSPSTSRTFLPSMERALPRLAQDVDLPLPPLLFVKEITFVSAIGHSSPSSSG